MSAQTDYLRAWVEAWNRGELEPFLDAAPADVEWVTVREHPAAGTHRGPEEVRRYLADWLRTMPGIQIELEEIEEAGDRVLSVMRMRGTGTGSGAMTETRLATVTTFRDGQPVRVEEYFDSAEARRVMKGA